MTSPRDLDRRVTQNRHDVDELYDKVDATNNKVTTIANVQEQHGHRLSEIQQTLDLHNTKLSLNGASLRHMSGRLERLEDTQRSHTQILDAHTETLGGHSRQLDNHGRKLDAILGLLREGRPSDGH